MQKNSQKPYLNKNRHETKRHVHLQWKKNWEQGSSVQLFFLLMTAVQSFSRLLPVMIKKITFKFPERQAIWIRASLLFDGEVCCL